MKLKVLPYLGGERGTERTIAHMRKFVDAGKLNPKVVLQAHKIVRGIDRDNYAKMASAIFNFIHKNISYVRDPVGVEFVKDPAITLKTKTGDCDDQSVLFAALAESIGIETRFKAVKADSRSPGEFSHVYAQAKIPGKGWKAADTIVPYAKFGWEVSGYPARTWGGANGMGFIDAQNASPLGDAPLAAGSVGYPEDDYDTAFGSPFDAESGGMYDELPVLGEGTESISTIVDTPDDFWHWGGSTDLGPGPGLKSRMLPPGVESMNGLKTEVRNGVLGYYAYDAMGNLGWRPFKKLRKRLRSVGDKLKKGFRKIGDQISEGAQKIGKKIADNLGMSTPESREKASREAVTAALKPAWESDGVQLALELLRRSEAIVKAQREGKVPPFIKGPPPTSLSGLASAMGQLDWEAVGTEILNTGPLAPYTQALNLIKGLGAAKDQEAAEKALKSYVEQFPHEDLNTTIQEMTKQYVAAGGLLPSSGTKPPKEFVDKFLASARATTQKEKGGTSGYYYYYLMHLLNRMKNSLEPLKAAAQVLKMAHDAHTKVAGKQTIQISAQIVKKAIDAGVISVNEVPKALEITKKVAQGYTLTPQEQQLASKIAAGAQPPASGLTKYGLPIAAAAGAAALLL